MLELQGGKVIGTRANVDCRERRKNFIRHIGFATELMLREVLPSRGLYSRKMSTFELQNELQKHAHSSFGSKTGDGMAVVRAKLVSSANEISGDLLADQDKSIFVEKLDEVSIFFGTARVGVSPPTEPIHLRIKLVL